MEATLEILQGIEKSLLPALPSPPIWKLVSDDIEAQVLPQYPSFTGSIFPQIQFKVDTIHNKDLLGRLANDTKYGFSPPYKFTLVRATDPFHDKKQHTDSRSPWSKGDWAWTPKFSCRQFDPKTKLYKTSSVRIDHLTNKTIKADGLRALLKSRDSLHELRNHLLISFGRLLQDQAVSYETFLRYCGVAQLHHLEKQRKKIEAQMVDAYESWSRAFPAKAGT